MKQLILNYSYRITSAFFITLYLKLDLINYLITGTHGTHLEPEEKHNCAVRLCWNVSLSGNRCTCPVEDVDQTITWPVSPDDEFSSLCDVSFNEYCDVFAQSIKQKRGQEITVCWLHY